MKRNICFTDPTVDKPYGSHEGKKEPRSEYFMPAWTYLKTNMSTVMVRLTKWTYALPDNMSAMTTYEMEIHTSKE